MTLLQAKANLNNITYDSTAIEELDFYNKEFQRHHIGCFWGLGADEHKETAVLLIHSFELQKVVNKLKVKSTPAEFDTLKEKVSFFIDELEKFITVNNIKDCSMMDFFPKFT